MPEILGKPHIDPEIFTPRAREEWTANYAVAGPRGLCLFDCCGIFTAIIAYVIILGSYYVLVGITLPWVGDIRGLFVLCMVSFFAFMALWTHFVCMTTDPGVFQSFKSYLKI